MRRPTLTVATTNSDVGERMGRTTKLLTSRPSDERELRSFAHRNDRGGPVWLRLMFVGNVLVATVAWIAVRVVNLTF